MSRLLPLASRPPTIHSPWYLVSHHALLKTRLSPDRSFLTAGAAADAVGTTVGVCLFMHVCEQLPLMHMRAAVQHDRRRAHAITCIIWLCAQPHEAGLYRELISYSRCACTCDGMCV